MQLRGSFHAAGWRGKAVAKVFAASARSSSRDVTCSQPGSSRGGADHVPPTEASNLSFRRTKVLDSKWPRWLVVVEGMSSPARGRGETEPSQ